MAITISNAVFHATGATAYTPATGSDRALIYIGANETPGATTVEPCYWGQTAGDTAEPMTRAAIDEDDPTYPSQTLKFWCGYALEGNFEQGSNDHEVHINSGQLRGILATLEGVNQASPVRDIAHDIITHQAGPITLSVDAVAGDLIVFCFRMSAGTISTSFPAGYTQVDDGGSVSEHMGYMAVSSDGNYEITCDVTTEFSGHSMGLMIVAFNGGGTPAGSGTRSSRRRVWGTGL